MQKVEGVSRYFGTRLLQRLERRQTCHATQTILFRARQQGELAALGPLVAPSARPFPVNRVRHDGIASFARIQYRVVGRDRNDTVGEELPATCTAR